MRVTARDVMATQFHTLLPDTPVTEAIKIFKHASREEGRKIFGMMVTDADGRLVGMLSMYDILLYLRPKHIHIWGVMDDIEIAGIIDNACNRIRPIFTGDIMSTAVITVSPETHLMMILDIMIKKHIRRLPVIQDEKIVGMVYISDLFYHFLDRFSAD